MFLYKMNALAVQYKYSTICQQFNVSWMMTNWEELGLGHQVLMTSSC